MSDWSGEWSGEWLSWDERGELEESLPEVEARGMLITSRVDVESSPAPMSAAERRAEAARQRAAAEAGRVVYSIWDISDGEIVRQVRRLSRWDLRQPRQRRHWSVVRGRAGRAVVYCMGWGA